MNGDAKRDAARATVPYRALLVDYGGVLTTSLTVSLAAFCVESGVSPERLKDLFRAAYSAAADGGVAVDDMHDLVRAVETGAIEGAEFDRRLAEALSDRLATPLEPSGLTARLLQQLRPDAAMRQAVRAARRQGLRTGLISNTWGVTPPADLDDAFDAVVLSSLERVRKPEAAIYLLAANRVGVDPRECVFVDDVPANVDGARAVGMTAVLHKDPAITIPKLEEVLGVELR